MTNTIALIGALVAGIVPRQGPCRPEPLRATMVATMVQRIRSTHADTVTTSVQPEETATAAMRLGTRCVQLVTLRWDGLLDGGVIVYENSHVAGRPDIVFADWYPGARRPQVLTGGRFLFTWVSSTGTGTLVEDAVIMRPLGLSWAGVMTLTATRRIDVGGYSGPTPPTGSPFHFGSSFAAKGDTLIVTRSDSTGTAPGHAAVRVSQSRLILP